MRARVRSVRRLRYGSRRSRSPWLRDGEDAVDRRAGEHLLRSRRPIDGQAIHPLVRAEPEVQPPVVLAGEAGSAIDDAALFEIARLEQHFGANGAPVAARPNELQTDPVIAAVRIIAVEQSGLVLIRDDDVHGAAIRQVGERHGPSIQLVRHAYLPRYVRPAGDAPIEVDT